MSLGFVPGRWTTSFTNDLQHVSTFSNLASFCRLDLLGQMRHQQNLLSYLWLQFYLSANFGQVQTNLLVSFCLFKEDLKDGHEKRFVLPSVSTWLQHTHCKASTCLSVGLLWHYVVNLPLTGNLSWKHQGHVASLPRWLYHWHGTILLYNYDIWHYVL